MNGTIIHKNGLSHTDVSSNFPRTFQISVIRITKHIIVTKIIVIIIIINIRILIINLVSQSINQPAGKRSRKDLASQPASQKAIHVCKDKGWIKQH